MLTGIKFKNLRCFKDFTLEGLTPLTLISGRNNVGKTTLLEGIFLLLASRSPELFFKVNSLRGVPAFTPSPQGVLVGLEPMSLWEQLFSDLDMTQKLEISIKDYKGVEHTVAFEKNTNTALSQIKYDGNYQHNGIISHNMLQPVPGSYILNVSYGKNNEHEQGRFVLTQQGLALNFDAQSTFNLLEFAQYIGPNIFIQQNDIADWFGKIDLDGKKSEIVEALRLLDKDISEIFIVSKHNTVELYARWRSGKTRSIRTLGDGINKLLSYLLVMLVNPGWIFLLDEIETGFHYSFYPKLWELIAAVAQKTGSQVIATTHSYECIAGAMEGAAKVDASLLTYVRLGKEDDVVVPHVFHKDDLDFALKREMEIR